jgi:hypothetical protein
MWCSRWEGILEMKRRDHYILILAADHLNAPAFFFIILLKSKKFKSGYDEQERAIHSW